MARKVAAALLLVFATLLVAGAAGAKSNSNSAVLVLDADNFDETVANEKHLVVEFYAPWCGHCKKLEPEWEKAAKELKKLDPPVVLAKVDADNEKNKPLAQKFGIRGFPTIKTFFNGKSKDYEGPRESEGIINYFKKLVGPASKEINSAEQSQELIDSGDVVVIGVFESEASPEFVAFMDAADGLREEIVFAHTTDATLLPENLSAATPSLHLFKPWDDNYKAHEGEFTVSVIEAFITDNTEPKLPDLNGGDIERRFLRKLFEQKEKTPKVFAFGDFKSEDWPAFEEEVRAAADKFKDDFAFIKADATASKGAADWFGLKGPMPCIAVHMVEANTKFTLCDAAGKVESFLGDVKDGKVEPTYKSAEVPADEAADAPVKTIVGKTFNDVVFSGKDVLIEFYAPWCGHCKKLAPTYEEVGKHFGDDDGVVVAKMDATENDVPSNKFDVRGFPTINFIKGATGEVLTYNGERDKDSMVDYINEQRSSAGASSSGSTKDEL
eukprot:jgi/Chlat1/2337/Chrsp17S02613